MRRKRTAQKWIPAIGLIVVVSVGFLVDPGLWYVLRSLISGINVNHVSSQSAKSIQYLKPDMVRLDGFPWDSIEPKKGVFDYTASDTTMRWARDQKISVLGILQYAPGWANGQKVRTPAPFALSNCGIPNSSAAPNSLHTYPPRNPADFGAYASRIAKRYPDVKYWQIWNEPNNPIFWPTGPDAREYTAMLTAAYGKIKKANPKAQVVLGGISLNDLAYVNALYAAGAKPFFDILAVHLYSPSQAPSDYLDAELERMHGVMEVNGDRAKKIWLTEIGWYTGTALHAVSEEDQARYLGDTFAIARSKSYVGAVFWNTFMDCSAGYDTANPEHNYGLFKGDLTPKAAAPVMRGMMLRK